MPKLQRLAKLFPESQGDPKKTLLAGATVYLNFLSLTRHLTKLERSQPNMVFTNVAGRYLAFQDFREHIFLKSIPTRDISAAWAADMLCPAEYKFAALDEASDFPYLKHHIPISEGCPWYSHQLVRLLQSGHFKQTRQNLSRLLRLNLPQNGAQSDTVLSGFDLDNDGVITDEERKAALEPWTLRFKQTVDKWEEVYPDHKYRYKLDELPIPMSASCINAPEEETERRTRELAQGMKAQAIFQDKMLAMGPKIINNAYLSRAADRYTY